MLLRKEIYIFNISLTSGVKLHIHLCNVVVRFILFPSNSANLMLRYGYLKVPQSLLDFEITSVDCIVSDLILNITRGYIKV